MSVTTVTTVATVPVDTLVTDLQHLSLASSTSEAPAMAELEKLAKRFYPAIHSNDLVTVTNIVGDVVRIMESNPTLAKFGFQSPHIGVTSDKLNLMNGPLRMLVQSMNYPVQLNESDGKNQQLVTSSLGSMMMGVMADSDGYHNVHRPCNDFDPKKGCCKKGHALTGDDNKCHLFECDFHQESLAVHLLLAMILVGFRKMKTTEDPKEIFKIMLTALLHDCGKVECTKIYEFDKCFTGFPAHGEIGMMKILMHRSPQMETDGLMTFKEYYDMATAIGLHMCGYHGSSDKEGNRYKRDLLKMESQIIKDILADLRVGDHLGALAKPDLLENHEEYLTKNQAEFVNDVTVHHEKPLPTRFIEFCAKYRITSDKLVIHMIGKSGAGKSVATQKLMDALRAKGVKVGSIGRDECMTQVLTESYDRFKGKKYGLLFAVYEGFKTLNSASSQKKPDQKAVSAAEDAVNNAIDVWNEQADALEKIKKVVKGDVRTYRNVVKEVQDEFSCRFFALYNDTTFKVIICDTMMNLFPGAAKAFYPKEMADCFKIHFHVQNYTSVVDGSNVGEMVEQQLKVTGPFGPNQILHPEGSSKGADLKMFASVSTDNMAKGPVPASLGENTFRPNYVVACMRTPEGGEVGYTEAVERVAKFVVG